MVLFRHCFLIVLFYFPFEVNPHKSTKVTKKDVANLCTTKSPNGDCPTDSVPVMITNAGFAVTNYTIVTTDGYYLTAFRIPMSRKESKSATTSDNTSNGSTSTQGKQGKKKTTKIKTKKESCKKPAVVMVHGILGDSSHFIMHDVDKAPAYVLADAGYDVWLLNNRGSVYSQKHKWLKATPFGKYWDYSHIELGNKDIPAALDTIIKTTGCKKVIYIGHSLGTTQFFSGMALQPLQNKKIKCMIALAPVAYLDNMKSVLKLFAVTAPAFQTATAATGQFDFIANNTFADKLRAIGCSSPGVDSVLCENLLFLVAGFDKSQIYKPWFPIVQGHLPGPTSSKTLLHLSQNILSKKFGKYKKLFDLTPVKPINLKKVTAPVLLFKADNDFMASLKDVNRTRDELGNVKLDYQIPFKGFNHLDFLWSKDINKYVNEPMLNALKNKCN